MATITGITAERMQAYMDENVTGGSVNGMGNLILIKRNGVQLDAGLVKGPQGDIGPTGDIGPQGPAGVIGGTTTERDARFGVPADDVARVALANQRVNWYNQDLGWIESYYTVTGLAGLTARGLMAGTASGWYPIGYGPEAKLIASASQSVTNATWVTAWNTWGTGGSYRRGGNDWFTHDVAGGKVVCVKAGNYDVTLNSKQQTGTGVTYSHLMRNNGTIQAVINSLNSSFATTAKFSKGSVAMSAGNTFGYYSESGAYSLNFSGGEAGGDLSIKYASPLLTTD